MIEHLWVSTATALAAVVLALALGRAPARVRFAILLLATLRFAIPTAWLSGAGEVLAACIPSHVAPSAGTWVEGLLRPGSAIGAAAAAVPQESTWPNWPYAVWLAGAGISLAIWIRRGRVRVECVREALPEERAALDQAVLRIGCARPTLKIVAEEAIPGAAGILRPTVILPCGLVNTLSFEELEAVCAHEAAHIRRRDNLWAAVTRAVAAVFWFHPLVWWMNRRMQEERELACDELVVASGSAERYASAIGKVCLATAGSPGQFAGMSGTNLKMRLERIMSKKIQASWGFRWIPGVAAAVALSIPVGAGFVQAQVPAASPADTLYQQAMSCFQMKDFAQAEVLFRRMLRENPEDVRGMVGLLEVYMAQNRPAEAVRMAQDAAKAHADKLEYRLSAGHLLVRSEQYFEALKEYEAALALARKPEELARIQALIGETKRRMGDLRGAIEAYRRAKDYVAQPSLPLALLLDGTGDADLAAKEYEALVAAEPSNAIALNNLAYRLAERETALDGALQYSLRAQREAPNNPDIADTLGWIYLKKRMPSEAVQTLKGAMLLAPNDAPLIREHLAAALDMKGDWTPATRELRTLLDTAKTQEQLRRIQELLHAL